MSLVMTEFIPGVSKCKCAVPGKPSGVYGLVDALFTVTRYGPRNPGPCSGLPGRLSKDQTMNDYRMEPASNRSPLAADVRIASEPSWGGVTSLLLVFQCPTSGRTPARNPAISTQHARWKLSPPALNLQVKPTCSRNIGDWDRVVSSVWRQTSYSAVRRFS